MNRLFFSLSLIITALFLGYFLQQLHNRGIISLPLPIDQLRKLLQRIGLLFFLPISFMAAIWVVQLTDLRIALLPLFGAGAIICGAGFGLLLARMLKTPPKQTSVLFCSSSFTNIGAIGSLVCYMFLGEAGFALVALYKMFEEILYYVVGFPIARYIGDHSAGTRRTLSERLMGVITDPFVSTILAAFIVGLGFNLADIARPHFFETINSIFIPAGTFVLILSIGLGMQFSRLGRYLLPAFSVTLIKALCIPMLITSLAWLAGLGEIENGLPLKVVLVLSSMPVAFNTLVAASLYDLDLHLANSCWLTSTLSLTLVMPWLYWLLRLF